MIALKSLVTVNLNVKENAGWCLSLVRLVFGAPAGYAHATASFNAAKFKNYSRELPNVPVPVYFKWVNNIVGDKNFGVNQGHVVAYIPGKGFLSSPGKGYGQQWFESIVAVEKYFGCTFVGWTQDINGKRIAEPAPEQPPVVVAKPVTTGQGGDYHLAVSVPGYVTAANAADRQSSNSTVDQGDYKIFNESHGMVNITRDVNQPGWWINPADNVAPVPAPKPNGIEVGDKVAPNGAIKSYDGVPLKQWDPVYEVIQVNGDRAVLKARGAVWAAVRLSDIHEV